LSQQRDRWDLSCYQGHQCNGRKKLLSKLQFFFLLIKLIKNVLFSSFFKFWNKENFVFNLYCSVVLMNVLVLLFWNLNVLIHVFFITQDKKKIFYLDFLVSNIISNKLMFVRSWYQKLNLSSKRNNVRLVIKWKKNNLGRWIIINWIKKEKNIRNKKIFLKYRQLNF
jgi:hypothetical protein